MHDVKVCLWSFKFSPGLDRGFRELRQAPFILSSAISAMFYNTQQHALRR
jgi:hypothetical protein